MTAAPKSKLVKRRVRDALFRKGPIARCEAAQVVLRDLCEVGRVAAIGGLVRELGFFGCKSVRSDIDFVIEAVDLEHLAAVLKNRQWRKNRYGGYKIRAGYFDIEFWEARNTWAHRKGFAHVERLEDIRSTTFFNIDAILCPLDGSDLIASEDALNALNERYLDINLLENPNPSGSAVRALRRMADHQMRASERLVGYIAKQVDEIGWVGLVNLDNSAFGNRPILASIAPYNFDSGDSFTSWLNTFGNRLPKPQQAAFEFDAP